MTRARRHRPGLQRTATVPQQCTWSRRAAKRSLAQSPNAAPIVLVSAGASRQETSRLGSRANAGWRGRRSAPAVDLDHAVRTENTKRLRILVALAQDAQSLISHLAVDAGPLEHGSASHAYRMFLLIRVQVGLG